MEKTFSIFEAKTHFSNLIRQVKAGYRCQITDRGKPVAMICPIQEAEQSFEQWLTSILETNCLAKATLDAKNLANYTPLKKIKGGLKRFLESRD